MTFKIDPAAIPSITDRNPDGEALLGALQAIVPDLRERAGDAEAAGRIPQETIDELIKARAFQAVVPKRYGGLELPYPYIPQIFRVLGRGCSSTSWSMGFLTYQLPVRAFSVAGTGRSLGNTRLHDGPGSVA